MSKPENCKTLTDRNNTPIENIGQSQLLDMVIEVMIEETLSIIMKGK